MSVLIDLTGKSFGRLTVIRRYFPKNLPEWKKNQPQWLCSCVCGKSIVTDGRYLRDGDTKSCGCIEKEVLSNRNKIHGLSNTDEYRIWRGMKNRCYNKKTYKYPDYGGRGIEVCKRWNDSFMNFVNDIGFRPTKNHSLDRIDVNGNYTPINCRWATSKQQSRNKRNNHWLEHNGLKMILIDWAKLFNVNQASLSEMLNKGKSFDEIYLFYTIKKPMKYIEYKGKKRTVSDWARYFGVHRETLLERIENKQPFSKIYAFYKRKNKAA